MAWTNNNDCFISVGADKMPLVPPHAVASILLGVTSMKVFPL